MGEITLFRCASQVQSTKRGDPSELKAIFQKVRDCKICTACVTFVPLCVVLGCLRDKRDALEEDLSVE